MDNTFARAGVLMTCCLNPLTDSQDLNRQFLLGTLGAVRKCGCFGGEQDYLVEIELLVNGKVVRYTKDQLWVSESKISIVWASFSRQRLA